MPPREAVTKTAGTRVSPMTVPVSTSKVRICHDLFIAVSGRGINEDTDTSAVPAFKIGHVLRDAIWRILYLYGVAVVNATEKWLRGPTVSPGWRPVCSAVFLQPPSRILIGDASEMAWGVSV